MPTIRDNLPNGWRLKPLPEVAEINPRRERLDGVSQETLVSFVPMSAISEDRGTIARRIERPLTQVVRGYTFFREGDVLFAKITPCMENGKAAIARDLANGIGFGSTEFHVLRAHQDVTPEWLFYLVRQPSFREEAARNFTGSVGQQRVPQRFLEGQTIPIPPFEEQRRIAARLAHLLSRIEEATALRRAAKDDLDALVSAIREESLSHEDQNDWQRVPLGEVASIGGRMVDPRLPQNASLPHISGDNIEANSGKLLPFRSAAADQVISGKYRFRPGAVLYSKIRPYLRKACVVPFEALCSADIYPLATDANRLLPEFLWLTLLGDAFTRYAVDLSGRARMPKINREQLFGFPIPLPPVPEQRSISARFSAGLRAVEGAQQLHAQITAEVANLEAVILRDAVAGAL